MKDKDQEYLEYVAMQFRIERIRQKMTMRQLANKAGLVQKTINSIENAQENSRILTYQRIAAALGKTLKDIL